MRIRHKYSFRVDNSTKEIIEILICNRIKYKIGKGIPILSFEIYEDDNNWTIISRLMKDHSKQSIAKCVYSQKEMDNAEWFRIRAKWRTEYPQPEDNSSYKKITYDDANYCSDCGCGLTQKNSFRLKKSPKWAKKNFLMLNWIESELFVTDNVACLFEDEDVAGFEFLPVLSNKSKAILENVKQLRIINTLESGILISENDIVKQKICTKCHTEKYILSGRSSIVYRKEIFNISADIVRSSEVFGDGLVCLNMIFITKHMYNLFCKYGWEKELIVEPITLI